LPPGGNVSQVLDVASGFAWAELHTSARNPIAKHCSTLVERVARELAQAGWQRQAAITDNGSEFRSSAVTSTLAYYNFDRAHTGRLTNGRIPAEIAYGARKMKATK
jgi:transposase InsO family protein